MRSHDRIECELNYAYANIGQQRLVDSPIFPSNRTWLRKGGIDVK